MQIRAMSAEMNIVLFAVICVSLYTLVASQQRSPAQYNLTVQREEESSRGATVDLITLRCINATSGMMMRPRDVTFWLNRDTANDPDFKDEEYVIVDDQRKGIVFQLRVEGSYTCGIRTNVANVEESERVPLIALQTNFEGLELRVTRTYFVAAGNTVQLRCPVEPRGLSNFYYGQWIRNGTTIIEVLRPRRDGQIASINRNIGEIVDLDRETFALTLRSVNRSQANNDYRCVLHNLNPANGSPQEFTQAAFLNISLMVDEKPSVLKRPESFIVGLQNATTSPPTFTCTVGGAPEPRLYWTYIPGLDDDRPVHLFNNGEKYNIIWNTTKQTNGLFVVTSTVTFLSVTNTDGGIVRCNTGPDSDPAYADALLTVLGTADSIDVIVSRDKDIIYELKFPIEIQHPVNLNITYTSEGGKTDFTIPDVKYISTRTISYKEDVNELPFAAYYVSISLVAVNGSQRITGPATESREKIDTKTLDPIIVIIIIVGVVLVVITMCVVISTCIIAVLVYRHKQTTMIKDVFENPDKYTVNYTPEEKEEFMRKLQKRFRKNLRIDGDINAVTQFILHSAMEGLESDNKYREDFIEAVRNHLADSNTEGVEHLKPKDPPQSDQDSTEAPQGEAKPLYHPGRKFVKGEVIEMSPTATRKTPGSSKVTRETSESFTVEGAEVNTNL